MKKATLRILTVVTVFMALGLTSCQKEDIRLNDSVNKIGPPLNECKNC